MKKYKVTYLSYEGRTPYTIVEAEDEEQAELVALNEEGNYSGDCIHKIIDVEEV